MTALAFELTRALEASEPPEARGLARDEVRLMVATPRGEDIAHTRFRELPRLPTPRRPARHQQLGDVAGRGAGEPWGRECNRGEVLDPRAAAHGPTGS